MIGIWRTFIYKAITHQTNNRDREHNPAARTAPISQLPIHSLTSTAYLGSDDHHRIVLDLHPILLFKRQGFAGDHHNVLSTQVHPSQPVQMKQTNNGRSGTSPHRAPLYPANRRLSARWGKFGSPLIRLGHPIMPTLGILFKRRTRGEEQGRTLIRLAGDVPVETMSPRRRSGFKPLGR